MTYPDTTTPESTDSPDCRAVVERIALLIKDVDWGRLRGLDGVKRGVSIKLPRSSRYDRKDFCGFAAHPQPSTNHLVYGRTEGEGR